MAAEADSKEPSSNPDKTEAEWNRSPAEWDRDEIAKTKLSFEAAEVNTRRLREEAKKKGGTERDFAEATEFAWNQIKQEGLEGDARPYYEVRYSAAQGVKAAVHGREDGIATLILQKTILLRLDAIKFLLWVAIGLLAFIAYKVA